MPEGRVRRALEGHQEQARQSKRTATIQVDMDIPLDLDPARLYRYDENSVRDLFDRLEFRSLLARLPGRDGDNVAPAAPAAPATGGNGQASLTFDDVAAATTTLVQPDTDVVVVRDQHAAAEA